MIFSKNTILTTNGRFSELVNLLNFEKVYEINYVISELDSQDKTDEILAFKWICTNLPLSDILNYPARLFEDCAKHGIYLLENSNYLENIPEEIFLNYVLHPRVNEEELCNCREFFHSKVWDRIADLPIEEAVIELNYFNCENVMYQSTDERTASPLSVYNSGYGRCGEESTFAVNIYRAVGIPSRQVYAPRWSHCDDNHAWVEVYFNGCWHYLGACEPKEVVNSGWFTNAASRAMLVHSRHFGNLQDCTLASKTIEATQFEEVISTSGAVNFINNTKLYADTKNIKVLVKDEQNHPIPNAEVSFQILNYSCFTTCAKIRTNPNGIVNFTCGLGSINASALYFDSKTNSTLFNEVLVDTRKTDYVEIILNHHCISNTTWESFKFIPPREHPLNEIKPNAEQKAIGKLKFNNSKAIYNSKINALISSNETKAKEIIEKCSYSKDICDILIESRGNCNTLIEFLELPSYTNYIKEKLLLTLSKKDYRDVNISVLEDCVKSINTEHLELSDNYCKYVLCPRVHNEPLFPCREFILKYFSQETKDKYIENPILIWKYIDENIKTNLALEYNQITTCQTGLLSAKIGSLMSKKILFVSICRTLGIMARLNPIDLEPEYMKDGTFISVFSKDKNSTLILNKQESDIFNYYADFSLSLLSSTGYKPLDLSNFEWNNNQIVIPNLQAGKYRITTVNRLPNGTIHAAKCDFTLTPNNSLSITLEKQPAKLKEMLCDYKLEDFSLTDIKTNETVLGSTITKTPAILLWLEVGAEPTEHILNEMLENYKDFVNIAKYISFIVENPSNMTNPTLNKVLKRYKDINVYFDNFENVEQIARKTYVDPDKLPLILITEYSLKCICSFSGYNVGVSQQVTKLFNLLNLHNENLFKF